MFNPKVVRNRKIEGSSPVCSIFILRNDSQRGMERIKLYVNGVALI